MNSSRIQIPSSHFKYKEYYEFENFDSESWRVWMDSNWYLSVVASGLYLSGIYIGQRLMESRKEPFKLRGLLLVWNIFLSLLSLAMFLRVLPQTLTELPSYGTYRFICRKNDWTIPTTFWSLVFTLSKILEFGDTVFIILRKQPLIFLHWYHHITVSMFTFINYPNYESVGTVFGMLNSLIHSYMYAYYALKVLKIHVPKPLVQAITISQIVQMVLGLAMNVTTLVGNVYFGTCQRSIGISTAGVLMYGSYFILFLRFFFKAYGKTKRERTIVIESNKTKIKSF